MPDVSRLHLFLKCPTFTSINSKILEQVLWQPQDELKPYLSL
ncbi:hypothetical protein MC7420_2809 [Coleofasciculus chthonoplastes PCC 7420]|uniref:Uncharacterized protein n=1 Tax=Coleofasciculus chthonoplastes PCC 7420 TaxID=118168 RepID=B4W3I5_9CYAN|nr:hypothetical protein MC7420_2809 [Coleofasciculus chthonoplastes PCC 7420]